VAGFPAFWSEIPSLYGIGRSQISDFAEPDSKSGAVAHASLGSSLHVAAINPGDIMSSPNPLHLILMHLLALVLNNKGGVGKSCLLQALKDWTMLHSVDAALFQVDRQSRLGEVNGAILSIAADPKASRDNPELELKRFSPLLDLIETSVGVMPVIGEIGAGEVQRVAAWSAAADIGEDIAEWGMRPVLFVPFVAEAQSVTEAAWSVRIMRHAIPEAMIVLVENRRDGAIADLHPASAAAEAYQQHIASLSQSALAMVMPKIPGGSWRHFEAARCSFLDVVDMPVSEVMALTGLPRAEAKIARGDVAQWIVEVFAGFDAVFDRIATGSK
jgi:hypothetical protein